MNCRPRPADESDPASFLMMRVRCTFAVSSSSSRYPAPCFGAALSLPKVTCRQPSGARGSCRIGLHGKMMADWGRYDETNGAGFSPQGPAQRSQAKGRAFHHAVRARRPVELSALRSFPWTRSRDMDGQGRPTLFIACPKSLLHSRIEWRTDKVIRQGGSDGIDAIAQPQ